MNDRISGVAVVVHGQLDPSVQKTLTNDLPQVIRVGSIKVEEQLAHLSERTNKQLQGTFTDLSAHWGSVLDRMGQRLAKGNFTLNTEATLKGIKLIGEEIGSLGLSLTAGKLLDLGEQLRIPKTIEQVKTLREEFKVFVTQTQQYENWLRTFANRPEKDGLSSPLAGMTKYHAETHGEFNQRAIQSAEDAYENIYLAEEGRRRAKLTGRKLDDGGYYAGSTGLSPAAAEAYHDEAMKRSSAAGRRLDEGGYYQAAKVGLSPAAQALRDEQAAKTQQIISRVREQGGPTYALREDTYRLGPVPPEAPYVLARREKQKAEDRQQLIANQKGNEAANRFMLEGALERYQTKNLSPEQRRLNRGDQHRLRFGTQQIAFGIDDAIQSYHYGGIGASIRAASNNATALAGLGIQNPIMAASAVVAVSALSAVVARLAPMLEKSKTFSEDTASSRRNLYATTSSFDKGLFKGAGRSLFDTTTSSILDDLAAGEALRDDNQKIKADFAIKAKEERDRVNLHIAQQGMVGAAITTVGRIVLGDSILPDLEERNKALAGNNQQRLEAIQRIKANERRQGLILNNIGIENRLDALSNAQGRELSDSFAQGRFSSFAQYQSALERQQQEKENALDASGLPMRTVGFMKQRLRLDMERALNDPIGIERQIGLARINVANNTRSFNNEFNSYGGVGEVTTRYANMISSVSGQMLNGELSNKEGQRRIGLLSASFSRERTRTLEDEIEAANPDHNPLSRLEKSLTRRMQDFNLEKGLTDDERRRVGIAILTGAEEAKSRILTPSGTRRFSAGEGTDVNSAYDLELRGRMTGTYEFEKRADHSQKTMEEVRDAIIALQTQLKIQAEQLGRR